METFRKAINYFSSYWIVVLYGTALYVYLKTGQLPEFSHPDPKEAIPGFETLFIMFNYSVFFILAGFVLNLIFIIRKWNIKIIFHDGSFVFYLINATLWLINSRVDFLGVTEWFFD
ncbi:MAG: hypothetical protein A2W93_05960 [Bacteroidetes bacterium GWF2_43_63]|nr:MAG: hypothetical protein A2W94_04455 [Bacteroidetes bacterium GWE2_42_42]OFY55963.1 MAG: hypothetical protein A2W93_05960 [Bacteroidetes bacterium GWF2_43_63]HBG71529.1 hypothetical protein [Bacteroidales bacterium]HCB63001.1 hypothetical protein [Bacteroidales bacterium]HCY22290.1 hypothetical protein [Bacteroidales bacterium]